MRKLNEQQMKAVLCEHPRILCLAGAGTGKSTSLLARISYLVDRGVDPSSILALTFTNAAAFEMKERYRKDHPMGRIPEFRTFHSFCYHLITINTNIRRALGYLTVPTIADDSARKKILKEAGSITSIKSSLESLEKKSKRTTKEQYDYEMLKKTADKLMNKKNTITFDNLCYRICELFTHDSPLAESYKQQYKYIFVDEFQDTDNKQNDFVQSFKNSHIFLVGDALQCQPAGTMITLSDMSVKPIEDLQVGDYLLTYVPREGRYIRNLKYKSGNRQRYTKKVQAISKHFATNIVKVSSRFHSSCYTKDHITYAKIHYEGNEKSYVTYLMSNERGWWRVGSTKLFLESQSTVFGPRLRMQNEHGDRIWILGVYQDVSEAWLNEQIIAYYYGIPQTTWNHENVKYDIDDLQTLYDKLGDLKVKAKTCLEAYGRDIEYPIFTKGDLFNHFSKLHLFECRVGNLIPGIFDIVVPYVHIDDKGYTSVRNSYEVILSIDPQPDQWVYGLDVEGNHNYVGDGILTHNCLYKFRGADSSIIKRLSTDPEWNTIKLNVNYRSTKNICSFANINSTYANSTYRIALTPGRNDEGVPVNEIENTKYVGFGAVDTETIKYIVDNVKQKSGSTAIICRTNKEVSCIQNELESHNIVYRSGKREVDVANVLKSVGSNEHLIDWLASYLNSDRYAEYIRVSSLTDNYGITDFLRNFGNVSSIVERWNIVKCIRRICKESSRSIMDRCKDILEMLECQYLQLDESRCTTMKASIDYIYDLFSNTEEENVSDIYVGTIHSVKGLEFDNVYVVGVNGPNFVLDNEDNKNLYYVAITRAKNYLTVFVKNDYFFRDDFEE